MNLPIAILLTTIILLSISLFFRKRKLLLTYLIPSIGIIFSLGIIGISLLLDPVVEQIYSLIGFSLFIGSAITFIIVAIIGNLKDLKQHYHRNR